MDRQLITGVILCGGRGTRVGGRDKPLIDWQGRPLIEYVCKQLQPQVGQILISANRNQTRYAKYVDPTQVVADPSGSIQSPLVGVLSAMQRCATPWLLICTGDVPNLPVNLAEQLSEARAREPDPPTLLVAHDSNRQQHLHFLMHRQHETALATYLDRGNRSAGQWLAEQRATVVYLNPSFSFINVNQPADFH